MTTQTQTTPTTSSPYKPRIRYQGGTRYLVESRTRKGIGYPVDTLRLQCACLAGKHGRRCHHLVTALAYEDWRKRQQAQPPVAPAPLVVPAPMQQTEALRALSSYFE